MSKTLFKKNKKNACYLLVSSFIDDKVQEYALFVGNHQGDLQYLSKSEIDLKRPLELIDGKLQEAKLKLFE